MNEHLAFAQCLQRVLNETELTATEVARRLEMRSRNSIFRILKVGSIYGIERAQTRMAAEEFMQFFASRSATSRMTRCRS